MSGSLFPYRPTASRRTRHWPQPLHITWTKDFSTWPLTYLWPKFGQTRSVLLVVLGKAFLIGEETLSRVQYCLIISMSYLLGCFSTIRAGTLDARPACNHQEQSTDWDCEVGLGSSINLCFFQRWTTIFNFVRFRWHPRLDWLSVQTERTESQSTPCLHPSCYRTL